MTRIIKQVGLKFYKKDRFLMKCIRCNTVLESIHQNDYKKCKCGKVAIDGGPFIGSRILGHSSDMIDLSTWVPNQS
jgi:hypothetical protein